MSELHLDVVKFHQQQHPLVKNHLGHLLCNLDICLALGANLGCHGGLEKLLDGSDQRGIGAPERKRRRSRPSVFPFDLRVVLRLLASPNKNIQASGILGNSPWLV